MNDTVGVLLDNDLEQVKGGIGMLNKRWISLGLSGISVFSSMSSVIPNVVQRTYAAGDDEEEYCISELTFKETIEKMLNKLNEIKNNENNEIKEIEELERFLKTCSEEFYEYIEIINIMLDEFDGIQRATNIKEVKDNLVKSIDILKQGLESENPMIREQATSEKKYIEDVLDNNCLKQENLYNEINHKYQELKDKMNQKDQQLDIDELLTSMNGSMRSMSGMHNMFKKAISSKQKAIIDERVISQAIFKTMSDPNKKNMKELREIYFLAKSPNCLNIYRHVAVLSNLGNPFAFKLLEEMDGLAESKYTVESILVNDLRSSEGVSVNDIATERFNEIKQENIKLNEDFEEFMLEVHESEYEYFFKFCKPGTTTPLFGKHLDRKNQIYRRDLINNISYRKSNTKLGNWLSLCSNDIPRYGWKLHVSSQPNSAKKIAQIVLPYLMQEDANYKMCANLDALIHLNACYEDTQQGKFIAIYPDNEDHARKISNDLNKLLSQQILNGTLKRSDFCKVIGDAQLGDTGVLFTRFGNFTESGVAEEDRNIPVLEQDRNSEIVVSEDFPFDIKVSFLGRNLIKTADCMLLATKDITSPIIWGQD